MEYILPDPVYPWANIVELYPNINESVAFLAWSS